MKNILFLNIIFLLLLAGCQKTLERGHNLSPYDKLSPATAFNNQSNLDLYTNSFYDILPTANGIYTADQTSDIVQRRDLVAFLAHNGYSPDQSSGWTWTDLRNINYFIEKTQEAFQNEEEVDYSEEAMKHYLGIAKFFRAWFYTNKVIRFGDVPWVNEAIAPSDSDFLHRTRDPRELVMDSVLSDLNYAVENIYDEKDNSSSMITKWVALAFKSRVCLFEGTFRKYHSELNLESTANDWLKEAADAAETLMESGEYSIHFNASSPENSYRDLFIDETGNPPSDEILLAFVASSELSVLHDASWIFTSPTNGVQPNFVKQFINTFLDIDGTRFTDKSNFDQIPFWEEVKDRDLRLQQTIRMEGYAREDGLVAPDWSYTNTGYQPIKFTLDAKFADGSSVSDNSIPMIRYAEVLLNYAEAKAELGEFSQDDWDKTIKVLRERGGITNTAMPTSADSYLEETFYPGVSDPVLLEIRRERTIELALEGFRYNDLLRWKLGENLEMPWMGMYVPEMDVLYDLNQDGKPEVAFVEKAPDNKEPGVVYRVVDNVALKLTEGNKGNIIFHSDLVREWEDKKYYYPIPLQETILNPDLEQNDGW